MIYIPDTHALVWYVTNDPRLSTSALSVMNAPGLQFVMPTMVLVEIRFLYAKGRFSANLSLVYQKFITAMNCSVYSLDKKVVAQIPTGLNIHDSIIVATGLVYRDIFQQPTTIITRDGEITKSGLIQTLW